MKLIVGLGNPGKEYEKTRHNTGFCVVDLVAEKLGVNISRKAFDALTGKVNYKGEQVILMKPQTFMNESGRSVRKAVNYYHLDPQKDIIIIYDDMDMKYGQLRLREKGSAGGHNGIKSIIANIQTDQFQRIRVGIDKKIESDVVNYVLSPVAKADSLNWQEGVEKAANASIEAITSSFQNVMNKYNKGE